ncbi:hypothetical protein EMCRGX_G030541 [Ephydatia muelleri]
MNQVTLFRRIQRSPLLNQASFLRNHAPSEVESNHSSVHGDSNGSSLKSGIYVDNPSEEDDDESSHSVQENSKESPLKSGIFVDQPPAEDESNHSVHEYSKGGVHASDEDSMHRCLILWVQDQVCDKTVSMQQKPSEAELSCLSSEEETGISSGVKVWSTIGETTLLEEDKNVLMNGGWLNDKIIYAGMQLLQAAFPGFQNTILQVTNCFDIQRSTEFIQCLNVAGMHWITIATVGCTHGTVRVYDSLNKKLTKSLKNTVADILHSSTKKIEVEYVNVQYQLGSDDCGLFAIASACEICFGRDPNRYGERPGLGFYRFPVGPHDRRLKWIQAVSRKGWVPTVHSRICGDHFVSGRPVDSSKDVDYVPTVFELEKCEMHMPLARRKNARQLRAKRKKELFDAKEGEKEKHFAAVDALLLLQGSQFVYDAGTQIALAENQCTLTQNAMIDSSKCSGTQTTGQLTPAGARFFDHVQAIAPT